MIFLNRSHAGQELSRALKAYAKKPHTIVLGLPRGGVVCAYEVAKSLHLPLDILCARKLGAPGNPELAIGSVSETGARYLNHALIDALEVSPSFIEAECSRETKEAQRRSRVYRLQRAPLDLKNQHVIIVDDGIATGASMRIAIQTAKAMEASKITVGIPVAPQDSIKEIRPEVDEVICLYTPFNFQAVGQFYENFAPTEDQTVIKLMSASSP